MGKRRLGTTRKVGRHILHIEDAFPNRVGARGSASDLRKQGYIARVIDLGKNAGRLRFGVFAKKKK